VTPDSIPPWFQGERLEGVLDYWRVSDLDHEAINDALMPEIARHPIFGPMLAAIPEEVLRAQQEEGRERTRRAIEEGAWGPYERKLRQDGAAYARQGIEFKEWYDIFALAGRECVPRLVAAYGADPGRLTRALLGMQALFDRAMAIMAAEYIETKEQALRESEQRLATTLNSIGDGVIATDAQGRVERLNPVAERLMGWTLEECKGQPLVDVFEIEHEETGAKVDNPVERVLREGIVVGLANHTELLSRDGTRRPIADSAAPIRAASGEPLGVVLVFRDMSEERQAQREMERVHAELRRSQEVLAATVASLHEGLAIVDPTGDLIFRNPAAERMTGRVLAPGLLSMTPDHVYLLDGTPLPKDQAPIVRALRGEVVNDMELIVQKWDGSGDEIRVNVNAGPMRGVDGSTLGAVASFSDVTHLRALEKQRLFAVELELRNRRVAESNRLKSEFLANMSHELRTPLNSALILTRLLAENKDGNLTPEQIRYARSIDASGRDLLSLINDILDLSRIEAGKVALSIEAVPLSRLVSQLMERFLPLALEKRLDLRMMVDTGCPRVIETDDQRLQQILNNLLSNAVKFTEGGSVLLRVARHDEEHVVFTVEDTGIGIPADQQEVVFEAFRQVDGATTRRYGGTGLGLSISQKLAAVLGGEIKIRSAPGDGSCFSLLIPSRSDAGDTSGRRSRPPTEGVWVSASLPPLHGRRILLAEDEQRNIFALTALIQETGATVVLARNGREALQMLEEGPAFDLVLMDLMMPEMDGLTAIRAIRGDDRWAALPIIALTAKAMPTDRAQCLAAGASDYVAKPIDIELFLSIVHRWLPG